MALVFLNFIQLGYSSYSTDRLANRLLVLSICILSFIIFAYYTADLTSLMTSGPKAVTIKSFEEALEADYKFIVWPDTSYETLMKDAPKGVT